MDAMHGEWTDRLSEYLDDELSPEDRDALESHLAGCEPCRATLDALRRVVERAGSLTPRPPAADLWSGIAGRLDPPAAAPGAVVAFGRREARRFSFTLPQLAAAAIVLAAVSATLGVRMMRPAPASPPAVAAARTPPTAVPEPSSAIEVAPVSLGDAQYDAAVSDLERAIEKGRARLDKTTIAVVEQNLKIIDQALAQAQAALAADPANSYLTSHLVETRRRKLDLLRRAAALVSETN